MPIVPAAILFDLGFGGDPKSGRPRTAATRRRSRRPTGRSAEGNVGAGAGATVGKMGQGRAMKGGLGSASITLPDGLVVAALVAVNAVGDVIDPATGQVVAGVRTDDGKGLADARTLLRSGALIAPRPAACRREHDDRRRRHQREADQGAGAEDRADGARRLRARHLAGPHARRRRHDLLARHRRVGQRSRT